MNQQFHLFNINKLIKKSNKSINLIINSGKEEDKKTNNNTFFKKINVNKRNNERNSDNKFLDTEESINRGKNNDDINNRINSFLDFSVLNNKEDDNNISKERFGIIKSSIWGDVSAINAKDISIIEKKDE